MTIRSATFVLLLTLLWLLAWGDFSLWNLLSGAALATLLLIVFPPRARNPVGLRPLGFARLVLYVLHQLVTSNILVAREILSPRARVRAGVLAYRVDDPFEELLALMANVIALTPGTMTVEATTDPAVLYVHFLLLDDVEQARRSTRRLERFCRGALNDPTGRRATTTSEGAT